ncbi:hypothetical protein DRN52_07355, partial [Thermococci archaeon]
PATYRGIIRYAKRLAGIICVKEGVEPPTDILIRSTVKPRKDSNYIWHLSIPTGGIYDFFNERIVIAKWLVDEYLRRSEEQRYRFFCDYLVDVIAHETKHHIQWKKTASFDEEEAYPFGKKYASECFHRCIERRGSQYEHNIRQISS